MEAFIEQQARTWNGNHSPLMSGNCLHLNLNHLIPIQPLNPFNGPIHGVPAEVREHRSDCRIGLCRVSEDQTPPQLQPPPQLPLEQQVFEMDLHQLQQLSQTIQGRILELGANVEQQADQADQHDVDDDYEWE